MSHRYARRGTYQSRNPLAATNPLRSIPLIRSGAEVFGTSWFDGTWNQPKPAAAPETPAAIKMSPVSPDRELANAEASLRDAERVYDGARRQIGEANRRVLPNLMPAFVRAQIERGGGKVTDHVLTPERMRERKSYAFRMFNQRRGELSRARKRLDAARATMGLPSVKVAKEASGATRIRVSKPLAVPFDRFWRTNTIVRAADIAGATNPVACAAT